MNLSQLNHWFEQHAHGSIQSRQPLTGGNICNSQCITTTSGSRFFVKSLTDAPPNLFGAEAAGLDAIRQTGSLRVPEVYGYSPHWLVLEHLEPGPKQPDYWTALGIGLARMHQATTMRFGFDCDNYCGATPQPNPATLDGHQFFAEHRLLHQGRLAHDNGLLDRAALRELEGICARLPDLIPVQPASLVHGDLWAGNVHVDNLGAPVLIDPACYRGWAEADIAMTRLFGGFGEAFYAAYLAKAPLQAGWQQRADLYNLYHLLNHLNLFGTSYGRQVARVLKSYV
jgi:fructosamine-3-kinase